MARIWEVTDSEVINYLVFLRSEEGYDFFDLSSDHPEYDPCVIYAWDMDGHCFAIYDEEAEDLESHIGHFLTWARGRG